MCEQPLSETILLINSDISVKDSGPKFHHEWVRHRGITLVVGIRKDYAFVGGETWLNPYGIE